MWNTVFYCVESRGRNPTIAFGRSTRFTRLEGGRSLPRSAMFQTRAWSNVGLYFGTLDVQIVQDGEDALPSYSDKWPRAPWLAKLGQTRDRAAQALGKGLETVGQFFGGDHKRADLNCFMRDKAYGRENPWEASHTNYTPLQRQPMPSSTSRVPLLPLAAESADEVGAVEVMGSGFAAERSDGTARDELAEELRKLGQGVDQLNLELSGARSGSPVQSASNPCDGAPGERRRGGTADAVANAPADAIATRAEGTEESIDELLERERAERERAVAEAVAQTRQQAEAAQWSAVAAAVREDRAARAQWEAGLTEAVKRVLSEASGESPRRSSESDAVGVGTRSQRWAQAPKDLLQRASEGDAEARRVHDLQHELQSLATLLAESRQQQRLLQRACLSMSTKPIHDDR